MYLVVNLLGFTLHVHELLLECLYRLLYLQDLFCLCIHLRLLLQLLLFFLIQHSVVCLLLLGQCLFSDFSFLIFILRFLKFNDFLHLPAPLLYADDRSMVACRALLDFLRVCSDFLQFIADVLDFTFEFCCLLMLLVISFALLECLDRLLIDTDKGFILASKICEYFLVVFNLVFCFDHPLIVRVGFDRFINELDLLLDFSQVLVGLVLFLPFLIEDVVIFKGVFVFFLRLG